MDWKEFRDKTLETARNRKDENYMKYINSVTDRAWEHFFEAHNLSFEKIEKRFWISYQDDMKFRKS